MDPNSQVDVIICHHRGPEVLKRCLLALKSSTFQPRRVTVVDNGSTDGSDDMLAQEFPDVVVLRSPVNLGFARGNNMALQQAGDDVASYVLFLNHDAELESDCLGKLVALLDHNTQVAACQPKIRSLEDRARFDYAGGTGGYIDVFGYPFTRGRIMITLEADHSQYDDFSPVFWASGAVMLTRASVLWETKCFDDDFYATLEDVDLAWRMQLLGYELRCEPTALAYHFAGFAPGRMDLTGSYLRHRNSIFMLIKNYAWHNLICYLLGRVCLEVMAIGWAIATANPDYLHIVVKSVIWLISHLPAIWRKRQQVQALRRVTDAQILRLMYPRSIALDYFVWGKTTFQELNWQPRGAHQ